MPVPSPRSAFPLDTCAPVSPSASPCLPLVPSDPLVLGTQPAALTSAKPLPNEASLVVAASLKTPQGAGTVSCHFQPPKYQSQWLACRKPPIGDAEWPHSGMQQERGSACCRRAWFSQPQALGWGRGKG